MSHTSHQLLEQSRRAQRHAELADGRPDDQHGVRDQRRPREEKDPKEAVTAVKGTAPAAPPSHDDEAFRVSDGEAPQSDG